LIFLRLCISSLLGSPNGAHLILTILLLTHSFCQRIFSNSNQVPGMHIRSGNLALVHNTTLSLPEAKVHSCICFLSPWKERWHWLKKQKSCQLSCSHQRPSHMPLWKQNFCAGAEES
jgi:hypothetical protein